MFLRKLLNNRPKTDKASTANVDGSLTVFNVDLTPLTLTSSIKLPTVPEWGVIEVNINTVVDATARNWLVYKDQSLRVWSSINWLKKFVLLDASETLNDSLLLLRAR